MRSTSPEEVFLAAAQSQTGQLVDIGNAKSLFPGGRNGPYFDIESPVRNSAHALCTMAIAHSLTGDQHFLRHGEALARFLVDEHEFLLNAVAVHRQRAPKDWCNGVIGPAWLVEGLTVGGRLLDIPEAVERAGVLSAAQPFDPQTALWRRADPRKGTGGLDRTLNHQIYFAAAAAGAAQAAGPERVPQAVTTFLDHLVDGGFRVEPSGLIVHHVAGRNELGKGLRGLKARTLRRARNSPTLLRLRNGGRGSAPDMRERDLGYHIYSLFTLANLRLAASEHPFWSAEPLRLALELVVSDGWLDRLDENRYAYPYNAPGLELPLVARAFGDVEQKLAATSDVALTRQVERSLDGGSGLFVRSTPDRLTLSARIYELGLALAPDRKNP